MEDLNILRRNPDESVEEYTDRVCGLKQELRLTWEELKTIINQQTGENRSESYYRKGFQRKYGEQSKQESVLETVSEEAEAKDEFTETLKTIQKEKMKLSEYRVQTNADLRRIAREETCKEIAREYAEVMKGKELLSCVHTDKFYRDTDKSGILVISDWHYGIEIENYWNRYNPEIARERVSTLLDKTVVLCKEYNIVDLRIVNLADLICGRIHLPLRLQSRFDVITQIMEVSEILAEFISTITAHGINVHYYDCIDNHSRLEPNKNDSLEVETLARITKWYLKCRLGDNDMVWIVDNDFGNDIICFDVRGHRVVGVHGDKDSPSKVVDNLTLMTKENFDLVLTAHFHHFSCDEKNQTVVVSNGSLMGTDEYAKNLRLSAHASQNFIVVSDDCVVDSIHRIVLDGGK